MKQATKILVETEAPVANQTELVGCQITMTLEQLLRLVPRFSEGLRRSLQPTKTTEVNIASAKMGTNIIDPHCPMVDIITHGQKINVVLIDSGSGVKVITTETCERLELTDWPKCPFWLRMVDGNSVKLEVLLQNITIIIEGYSFQVFAVVLRAPQLAPNLLLSG